jgi:hypothetical protein
MQKQDRQSSHKKKQDVSPKIGSNHFYNKRPDDLQSNNIDIQIDGNG